MSIPWILFFCFSIVNGIDTAKQLSKATETPCYINFCNNGGTCYQTGTGMEAQFRCVCINAAYGERCENIKPENACSYNRCYNGGTCYRTGYGKDMEHYCICPNTTYGEQCEYAKTGCGDICSTCGENGEMIAHKLEDSIVIRCKCKDGYEGHFCDKKTNKDPCSNNPCQNSGKCYSNGNQYICLCSNGYAGTHCEIRQVP